VINELYRTNRVFCSSDYDACVEKLASMLPFDVHRFAADQSPLHGWEIPPKWDVIRADIHRNGDLVWDGTQHPLGVIALSAPFEGTVSREVLREHLHTVDADYKNPDAIPFHFRQQYRPWDRDWGFCVPRSIVDDLEPGEYDVVIQTEESPGYLDVLEYTHQGETDVTFAFVAHLDHPGMANDDLAGCAAGIELFRRLEDRGTKFSYRLILLQEIIASEYYLDALPTADLDLIVGSLFLEMLGSDTPLALQASASGESPVDRAVTETLTAEGVDYRTGPFRSIIGNDEIIWEAYGIAMPSLSRFPYPEYHTSDDNPGIISTESLDQSVRVLEETINRLEKQSIVRKNFVGVPATSHPSYDLYVDTWGSNNPKAHALRRVMDYLPMAPAVVFTETIQDRCDVEAEVLLPYLEQWAQTGLIDLV
jgi:aminopeptidase-like protein